MARLIRFALLGALVVAIGIAVTAAAATPPCAHGASSVGPVVLVNGHLAQQRSDLTPHATACLAAAQRTR